jgi:thiol-disulfide isomerase/thioredoxin
MRLPRGIPLDGHALRHYKAAMKSIGSSIIALLFASVAAFAGTPPAEQVLSAAKAKALIEHKTIFLHFGASWCSWCKRLDAFLDRPDIKPVFEKYFIPVKLVIKEKEQDKALENPGADEVFQKFGGPSGIPLFAFLDAKGTLLINSKRDGKNIGYPTEPQEIDWFVKMMKQAAPNISPEDIKVIETALMNFKKT